MTREEKREYMIEWRKNNADKIAQHNKTRLEKIKNASPEYREKIRAAQADKYKRRKHAYVSTYRTYREKNKEKLRHYFKSRYEARKPERRAYSRNYYFKNRARILAYASEYQKKNIDRILAIRKTKPGTPADVKNAYASVYRARKRGNRSLGADMIKIRPFYQVARRVSQCTGIRFSVDHIVPISRGGSHHQDNLQVLPLLVNIRKAARLPIT